MTTRDASVQALRREATVTRKAGPLFAMIEHVDKVGSNVTTMQWTRSVDVSLFL